MPTEDLFAYVYAVIDDAIKAGAIVIPARPGPAPGCSDAEVLAITQVRLLLGRRSEAGFLAEVVRDWAHLFPRNRIETTFKEITDQMELGRHGAHTFWGLLARTAAAIAAHSLMRVCLASLDQLT